MAQPSRKPCVFHDWPTLPADAKAEFDVPRPSVRGEDLGNPGGKHHLFIYLLYIYILHYNILLCFPLHPLMYLSILSLASTASITSMAFFSIFLGTSYFCKKEPQIMGSTLLQLSFVDILLSSTIPKGKKDRKTYGGPSILSSQCISSRGRIWVNYNELTILADWKS